MTYTTKTYEQDSIQAQISTFTGKGGVTEYQVLISVTDPALSFLTQLANVQKAYASIVNEMLDRRAMAVFRRYFLSDANNQADAVTQWECDSSFCALSIVQQAPLNGSKIALWTYFETEMQARANNCDMFEVTHNNYRHLWTGGASNTASNSEYQTRLILNDYVFQLTKQQCTLADDCIRTWFFVQNVDVNYTSVVKARKETFITQNLTEKTHYIASTGIEGRHPDPAISVQMDAYAVKGLQPGQISFLYAPGHLNPTYEYGVTFERGVAVTYGDRKQIYISGTASINNKGEIVHPGNILLQTQRMMENITALLNEAGAEAKDIMQAIVYLRDIADYTVVKNFFEVHYPALPHLIVHAPVCRPGWLIETECIAVIPADRPEYGCL